MELCISACAHCIVGGIGSGIKATGCLRIDITIFNFLLGCWVYNSINKLCGRVPVCENNNPLGFSRKHQHAIHAKYRHTYIIYNRFGCGDIHATHKNAARRARQPNTNKPLNRNNVVWFPLCVRAH